MTQLNPTKKEVQQALSVTGNIKVRKASRDRDHKKLVKLASLSKFTAAFSNIMFSSEEAYEKGWIRVGVIRASKKLDAREEIVALTCVRHKVREPKTVLYFLIVHPNMRGYKVGAKMLRDLEAQSPHRCLKFNVSKENPDARKFYQRYGYRVVHGNALHGTGWEMERSW